MWAKQQLSQKGKCWNNLREIVSIRSTDWVIERVLEIIIDVIDQWHHRNKEVSSCFTDWNMCLNYAIILQFKIFKIFATNKKTSVTFSLRARLWLIEWVVKFGRVPAHTIPISYLTGSLLAVSNSWLIIFSSIENLQQVLYTAAGAHLPASK